MSVKMINTAEQQEKTTDSAAEYKPKPVYEFFKRAFDICSSLAVSVIILIPVLIICPHYHHK